MDTGFITNRIQQGDTLRFDYTNWKGIFRSRLVRVLGFSYGCTEYHKNKQWFLTAYDMEDNNMIKQFALNDIHIHSIKFEKVTMPAIEKVDLD